MHWLESDIERLKKQGMKQKKNKIFGNEVALEKC